MAPERSFTNSRKTSKSSTTNYPRDKSSIISGLKLLLKLTPFRMAKQKKESGRRVCQKFPLHEKRLSPPSPCCHHQHSRPLARSLEGTASFRFVRILPVCVWNPLKINKNKMSWNKENYHPIVSSLMGELRQGKETRRGNQERLFCPKLITQ